MANEGRLGREGLVIAHRYPDSDTAARIAREAAVVAHHYPEASTAGRLGRLALVIAISWPHGWDIYDDPGLEVEGIGEGPIEGGGDDITPPAVPVGLTALPGDTFVFLNWTSNGELDMASYKVYQATSAGGPFTLIATVDESEEMVTGLTNGTEYWFKISAVDSSGNESSMTASVSATPAVPPVGVAPAVPTGLAATPGDKHVDLSWNANTETDLAFYSVYQATASGGPYTLVTTRTTTSFSVTGLTNTTPYWFKISATDTGANESAQSAFVTATPTAVTPPAGRPTPTVIFNSGNLYTAAKVTAEAAGTVFGFTITGGTGGGARYENATIPDKDNNQYVGEAGVVLDGNGVTNLAFVFDNTVTGVKIWDIEFTDYLGQNSSGVNNTKGAAAIRLRDGWEIYGCYGHHNKYSALACDGDDIVIEENELAYNGQYGFRGAGTDNRVENNNVHHNGGIGSLDVGGDTGGCKIVQSVRFSFITNEVHHNIAVGTQGGNGLWTDINNIDTLYDGNNVHDNDGAGIFHEVSLGGEIKNNTLTNNGQDNSGGGIHPVKGNIQLSNSGGDGLWVHDNVITVTSGSLGHYGISMFNSNHFQWTATPTNVTHGCLGARNMLIEDNTINMSGGQWKAAMAITGNLPTSRNAAHFCGQLPITASGSNNVIRNNTVILTGGQHPGTPYIRAGTRISANSWLSFGYT